MRILVCFDCKTMEILPDYDGPLEEADVPGPDGNLMKRMVPPMGADAELDHLTAPHAQKEHTGQVLRIPNEQFAHDQTRDAIMEQITKGLRPPGQGTGFEGLFPQTYQLKDTLHDDAIACFNRHKRPQDGCIDWHDRSKRLGNPTITREEKRELKKEGMSVRRQERFLCDYCPVASQVQQKKNEADGLYDK